jgi:hypothetical protein
MLKCTYTETGLYIEHLAQSWEEWIALRVILSVRAGQPLSVEQGSASFLLPTVLVDLPTLETVLQEDTSDPAHVSICDADYCEVNLQGTWVTSKPWGEEGVFVAHLPPAHEALIFELWQKNLHYTVRCARIKPEIG